MTPEMAVECLDSTGSCSRSSCECDGKLFADIWHLGNVQRQNFETFEIFRIFTDFSSILKSVKNNTF